MPLFAPPPPLAPPNVPPRTYASLLPSAQVAVSTGDVSTGDWTVVPLYPKVDEAYFDDSDYISSASQPNASTATLSFGSLTDPGVDQGHVIHYRYRLDPSQALQLVTLVVSLMQGATLIASWTHNVLSTTWTAADQPLTAAQAATITDYTALRLQFQATQ